MKTGKELSKLTLLTMELNLKVKEYNLLCKELDDIEHAGIIGKEKELTELKNKFSKNYDEIVEINKHLSKLKTNNDNNSSGGKKGK